MRFQWPAIAYGLTMLSSACMNNLFVTYYIHYFVDTIKVPSQAFFIGQAIFM